MNEAILNIRPATFLFDLDGTLINSETLWSQAIVSWLGENGVSTELATISALVFGHSWLDIHDSLLEHFPSLPRRTADQDALNLRAHYTRLVPDQSKIVIPSSVAFYREAARIAPCAVVSGSPRDDVKRAVTLCGIDGVTRFSLGMEDYANGKPAPDGYLAAAQKLGVRPDRCIVVEDSTAGVKSGIAAGMNVIGLDRNRMASQDFTGCFVTVPDLSDLIRR